MNLQVSASAAVRVSLQDTFTALPFSSAIPQLTLLPDVGMSASGACRTNTASPALGLLVRALNADTLGVRYSFLPGGITVPEQKCAATIAQADK